ncbi:MAG: hypothetical protein HONBIEJF_00510 [Fimbriimonadaceae bacterium]|nr:hypothetical protein [Fimbriimonadaceae bacterium]
MAVKPLSLTQKMGRIVLTLAVTLSLTNAASAVIDCMRGMKPEPTASCCAKKVPTPMEQGCCCEVSSTEGHPSVIAKVANTDEIAQVVLVSPAPIPVAGSPATAPGARVLERERPPSQIVVLLLAPKRAPPTA